MYKSIMVPLDGTRFSEEALPVAIRLARASGARLLLVRVVDRYTPSDEAHAYLAEMAYRLLAATGVQTSAAVLRGGTTSSIRNEAARVHCDLIVMSTHAHGAVGRLLQSSTADRIARSVACPVLLVRARGANLELNVHRRFLHILVPLDGTVESEDAVDAALRIAITDNARLTLLHVAQPEWATAGVAAHSGYAPPNVEPEETERMSYEYLDGIADRIRNQRMHPVVDVRMAIGVPADEIIAFADEDAVDLITMSTCGVGGMRRLVLGSTVSSVIEDSRAAVLLIPRNVKR